MPYRRIFIFSPLSQRFLRDAGSQNAFLNGSVADIVEVLKFQGAFRQSALRDSARANLNTARNPEIQSPLTQEGNATLLQNALNILDGRCSNTDNDNRRFIVSITDDMTIINDAVGTPIGTNMIIEITDRLWDRKIMVAITQTGHAEITSINSY